LGSVAEYFELPVFHNSKYIGGIKGKNTIKYETAPGNLALTAVYTEVNFASTVHLQAKAGETYYVMADLEGGSYTMKSTPSGELAHYFLSNVTGNEAKIAEMNKVLKKAASTSISGKKKQDYE